MWRARWALGCNFLKLGDERYYWYIITHEYGNGKQNNDKLIHRILPVIFKIWVARYLYGYIKSWPPATKSFKKDLKDGMLWLHGTPPHHKPPLLCLENSPSHTTPPARTHLTPDSHPHHCLSWLWWLVYQAGFKAQSYSNSHIHDNEGWAHQSRDETNHDHCLIFWWKRLVVLHPRVLYLGLFDFRCVVSMLVWVVVANEQSANCLLMAIALL